MPPTAAGPSGRISAMRSGPFFAYSAAIEPHAEPAGERRRRLRRRRAEAEVRRVELADHQLR